MPAPATLTSRLRTIGPGVVFALTVLGPGDFVSNAVTGATHGYLLLWALLLSVGCRYVWLDCSARYVMATGEGLMDGYARFGAPVSFFLMAAMFLVRMLANLYKLALLASAAALLLPEQWMPHRLAAAALVTTAAYWICDRGGYAALEKIFKFLIAAMCAGLLVAAILARPDPVRIVSGLFLPSLPADRGLYGTAFILMALIGTEAGSLTNITYSYYLRQKGWRDASFLRGQRHDLFLSVACLFFISACTQVAAAAALLPAHVSPSDSADLVKLFTHALGEAGRVIFAFGICASAFSGFVGATTGYALVAGDFLPRLPRARGLLSRPRAVYRLSTAIWCFGPLLLLAVTDRPVWLVLAVSALMAACIPVLAVFLLLLASNRQRMGALVIGRPAQLVLGALAVISSALCAVNLYQFWIGGPQ